MTNSPIATPTPITTTARDTMCAEKRREAEAPAYPPAIAPTAITTANDQTMAPDRAKYTAATKLMQVGKSIMVGLVDDYGVGVGDVQAAFDDRRADQDVRFVADELQHRLFHLVALHLSVADDHPRVRHHLLHLIRHLDDVFDDNPPYGTPEEQRGAEDTTIEIRQLAKLVVQAKQEATFRIAPSTIEMLREVIAEGHLDEYFTIQALISIPGVTTRWKKLADLGITKRAGREDRALDGD